LEYIISKTTRQNLNGALAFFADYPTYIWVIGFVILIALIWVVVKWRKNNTRGPRIPPKYRGYVRW